MSDQDKKDAARYRYLKEHCLDNYVESDGKFGFPDFGEISFWFRRREWKDGRAYVAREIDEAIDDEIEKEKT